MTRIPTFRGLDRKVEPKRRGRYRLVRNLAGEIHRIADTGLPGPLLRNENGVACCCGPADACDVCEPGSRLDTASWNEDCFGNIEWGLSAVHWPCRGEPEEALCCQYNYPEFGDSLSIRIRKLRSQIGGEFCQQIEPWEFYQFTAPCVDLRVESGFVGCEFGMFHFVGLCLTGVIQEGPRHIYGRLSQTWWYTNLFYRGLACGRTNTDIFGPGVQTEIEVALEIRQGAEVIQSGHTCLPNGFGGNTRPCVLQGGTQLFEADSYAPRGSQGAGNPFGLFVDTVGDRGVSEGICVKLDGTEVSEAQWDYSPSLTFAEV